MTTSIEPRTAVLTDLLARLEATEGADRELDRTTDNWRMDHEMALSGHTSMSLLAPPYTASLDASLGLVKRVLPGVLWRVGSLDERAHARLASYGPDGHATLLVNTHATTPALALLCALLKAIIAQEPSK